ncbi:hypothetical protein [Halomonas organivorans]|uniref:Uncharacterized protein n=1 Tax=Halomonas organivorans TaxID=257772 RepID=A0A7W5BWF0_9GAMM|nr:hypothetical protein [Halomonas organivorans]MBB3139363.1 hypothetical protein [Halomonas organivorans]
MGRNVHDSHFRHRYLSHDALTHQLKEWVQAYLALAHLQLPKDQIAVKGWQHQYD